MIGYQNMPRLSLYRPVKQNDYRFLDRTISEQLTVGGTDLYIHKYLGQTDQGASTDYTQPQYDTLSPMNIQDLLFLENRDRTYDPSVYRLRGHYNVQNLDFDLSQFGLFLNNDIIFIVVHYNDMIDIMGRKLMVGDVIELPHLLDFNPLDEKIPTALKRFYQITDANFASEGFSQTWFPHLWRIKCEKLVNSEEFSQILQTPTNTDNYLGQWDKTKTYVPGYTVQYGDKIYTPKRNCLEGITMKKISKVKKVIYDDISRGFAFDADAMFLTSTAGQVIRVTKFNDVEYKENEVIAWRHLGRWIWRYELQELSPNKTLVTETFDGRPSPFQWWLNARKAYPFTQIALAKTLVRLKKLVEAQ